MEGGAVRIESSSVPMWRTVVFASVWNVLVWPNAYFLFREIPDRGRIIDGLLAQPWVLLWLIFPIIAVVSAFRAIRLGISAAVYGRSQLTMRSGSAVIGGNLDAVIRAPRLHVRDGGRIRLKLLCRVDQIRTDSIDAGLPPGSQGALVVTDKWKVERIVTPAAITTVDDTLVIPVQVPIPSAGRETGKFATGARGRTDHITWWLYARAEPRRVWEAAFEVPVVRNPNLI